MIRVEDIADAIRVAGSTAAGLSSGVRTYSLPWPG
jgi:hypothetical protein